MLTAPDFEKKQIVFVFFNEGEKMAFGNDNLQIKDADGKIKFQCSCYRIYIIFAVGNCSLTSVIIQKAKKFGFFIALYTAGFRLYSIIGAEKEGNTLLRRKQYNYNSIEIARFLVQNKIYTQYTELHNIRNKNELCLDALDKLKQYYYVTNSANDINSLMAYEGLASKIYFQNYFNNTVWHGRQPRIKRDAINATLDIGYTLLFSFVESLLSSFGFDNYCGVLHQQFYMRKSLVCDIVEPFRTLIDHAVKKAIGLKQIKDDDFLISNGQYRLKWEKSPDYIKFLMSPILDNKQAIFMYIQSYYRCFMKEKAIDEFPFFAEGEVLYGNHKL